MSTQADLESSIGRRRFLQGVGATAAIGAGLASTGTPAAAFDWQEVATSDTAKMIAATAVAGPIGLGWALRDVGVLANDSPPEGLTAGALEQGAYETSRTRESTNASTFVDNLNIVDGIENTAYTEGKIAAIEALNDGLSQAEVETAATDAANAQSATVQTNLLKSWNESVAELDSLHTTVESHADLSFTGITNLGGTILDNGGSAYSYTGMAFPTETATLADGSELQVSKVRINGHQADTGDFPIHQEWSPLSTASSTEGGSWQIPTYEFHFQTSSGDVGYLFHAEWDTIWSAIGTAANNVSDGLITWVDSVYGQVQSGELQLSDLITPSDRAAMMADEESTAQAVADLAALNIPVDVEREATVTIEETSATLRGTLGITDESDGPIESGTTYTPSNLSGDVYLTFDVSLLEGDWSAFETGVDGGNMTLTDEPYPGTVYRVDTAANETATINASDWQEAGDGTWYYDASTQLDTTITEIADIDYFAANDEPNYQTIKLDSSFTVETFTNTETGEEADSASFSSSEPQDDTNYITQEEWTELQEQNEELIQKYEESQDTGNGGGITIPGFGDVQGFGAIAGGVAVVALTGGVLKKVADFYLPG